MSREEAHYKKWTWITLFFAAVAWATAHLLNNGWTWIAVAWVIAMVYSMVKAYEATEKL